MFAPQPKPTAPAPDPRVVSEVGQAVAPVENADLRAALERLGRNVLSNSKR